MAKQVFRPGKGMARVELQSDRLWWYPPKPPVIANQPPTPNLYFARSLLMWMPYRFFNCIFRCTEARCEGNILVSGGIQKRVRDVLDVDGYYYMGTEVLVCYLCKKNYLSWSSTILNQLDPGHRSLFPAIITQR